TVIGERVDVKHDEIRRATGCELPDSVSEVARHSRAEGESFKCLSRCEDSSRVIGLRSRVERGTSGQGDEEVMGGQMWCCRRIGAERHLHSSGPELLPREAVLRALVTEDRHPRS